MKITIGIDPSLNSTGICINREGVCEYYIITSKMTKKMSAFRNKYVKYLPYEKADTNKKLNEYYQLEQNKADNIYNVCTHIRTLVRTSVKETDDLQVYMEGISYGSVGSAALADLAGLNFAIRMVLIEEGVPFVIVSPNQNKKFATGNGAADKEQMIFTWLKIEKHLNDITEIKIDDLADAYFLSNYYREQKNH